MKYDFLIVGAGIIGLTIAYKLKIKNKNLNIVIIEKEEDVAKHASGRNSGVLHAGFYYTANSLKAKFTVLGNAQMKQFCKNNGIFVNETKKVVIAKNSEDLKSLYELQKRGEQNGVQLQMIDEKTLSSIDSNIKTYKKALFSPSTASVEPKSVCYKLKDILIEQDVKFIFDQKFEDLKDIEYNYLINCAGLYADKIAKLFGLAKEYTILPFKGIYLKYTGNDKPISTNVYPVPNLKNPFLGVHYTITSNGDIKVGPTAIPALWRENYKGFNNFKLNEFLEIIFYELKLFINNSFNFRNLAMEEVKNYNKNILINKAKGMVYKISNSFKPMPAGIRAQLLNTKTNELVMDFLLKHTKNSTHILNAVSPAFTCSFSFAEYVIDEIERNKNV